MANSSPPFSDFQLEAVETWVAGSPLPAITVGWWWEAALGLACVSNITFAGSLGSRGARGGLPHAEFVLLQPLTEGLCSRTVHHFLLSCLFCLGTEMSHVTCRLPN